jgi:hypothetical protein
VAQTFGAATSATLCELIAASCRPVADYVVVMSDEPLTNAAVEFTRAGIRFANVMERDEFTGERVTDDFVFEDRRSGFNWGLVDASAYAEAARSVFDVGSGRPSWSIPEVIAVRGQRIAAFALVVDYGDDTYTDMIVCVRFDPRVRLLQRRVLFDIDARDAAFAELDRMRAEIDD